MWRWPWALQLSSCQLTASELVTQGYRDQNCLAEPCLNFSPTESWEIIENIVIWLSGHFFRKDSYLIPNANSSPSLVEVPGVLISWHFWPVSQVGKVAFTTQRKAQKRNSGSLACGCPDSVHWGGKDPGTWVGHPQPLPHLTGHQRLLANQVFYLLLNPEISIASVVKT